jgi:hypothetical protein
MKSRWEPQPGARSTKSGIARFTPGAGKPSTAYPNPERRGCPPVEAILAMAGHTLDPGDPAYGHAVRCSPCLNELWEIQGESDH